MSTQTDTPTVYIACLASYNAGRLIGEHADATDIENLNEAVEKVKERAIEAAKKAGEYPVYFGEPEEFAIHDYDGFGSLSSSLGEYPDWERVVEIGRLIEENGEQFMAWCEFTDNINDIDTDELEETSQRQCVGSAESEEDYARERALEMGVGGVQAHWPKPERWGGYSHTEYINIIEELENYIDWEKVAQEYFDHGTYTLVNGYVFDSEA